MYYDKAQDFNGIHIIKPARFFKKNSQKFVGAGQKVPAPEPDKSSSLRQTHRLPDGTAHAKPADKLHFEIGQTRITPCKNNDFDNKIKSELPDIWLPFIKDDTPIILDLSDIVKPYAKKMDYLATVRDGSTGELVNGYWLVVLYASFNVISASITVSDKLVSISRFNLWYSLIASSLSELK